MKRIQVTFGAETLARLTELAAEQNSSLSWVVAELTTDALARRASQAGMSPVRIASDAPRRRVVATRQKSAS